MQLAAGVRQSVEVDHDRQGTGISHPFKDSASMSHEYGTLTDASLSAAMPPCR